MSLITEIPLQASVAHTEIIGFGNPIISLASCHATGGNICWARSVHNSPSKGKSRIFKYEVIDPVASTIATLLPKKFAKEYIPAPPGSKPPYTMKEYEKWDAYCFGGYDPQLTEKQEARNYNEAHWQQILAQEAIDKQLKQEAI